MIVLLGAVGWGLIAIGALTHSVHHDRLRNLLAVHLDSERLAAAALAAVEVALALALPVGVLTSSGWTPIVAVAAGALGVGFTFWILRLLLTGSELPCACSFSAGPTTPWSLARAVLVVGAIGLAFVDDTTARADLTVGLVVGLSLAAAIHVLPEALSWPAVARAQLARIDSHAPTSGVGGTGATQ